MEKMMALLIWHCLPYFIYLGGCLNFALGVTMIVKTEIGENGELRPMANGVKFMVIRILDIRVPLPICVGLTVFAFGLGLGVMDFYRISKSDTYKAGYAARDIEAYTSLVQRPNIRWRVARSYLEPRLKRTAYDLELKSGQVVENFIPCEHMGWYEDLVITGASYYNRGDCMSFSGPSAYWTVEKKGQKQ